MLVSAAANARKTFKCCANTTTQLWNVGITLTEFGITDMSHSFTNEEKRKIWMEMFQWQADIDYRVGTVEALAEAFRRYPDPCIPTIVTRKDGIQERINPDSGLGEFRWSPAQSWCCKGSEFDASHYAAMGDCAQEYFDHHRKQ